MSGRFLDTEKQEKEANERESNLGQFSLESVFHY